MCAARRVNKTVGEQALGPRMTMGTKTAACAGARSETKLSLTTSGCQTGGFKNRALIAWGKRWADGTAGKSWSICQTGTCRGSKGGFLDTVVIYNREDLAPALGAGPKTFQMGTRGPIKPKLQRHNPVVKCDLLRNLATLFF